MPLNGETRGLIDLAKLRLMRPHAYIINCARGGVIVEDDLLTALDEGALAGAGDRRRRGRAAAARRQRRAAAPPSESRFATPHLGGSTHEALARIANELAEDIARVLLGAPGMGAVNAPVPDGPEADRILPFLDVAYRMGRFFPQFASGAMRAVSYAMLLQGELAEIPPEAFVRAFLSGLLQTDDRPARLDRQRRDASRPNSACASTRAATAADAVRRGRCASSAAR